MALITLNLRDLKTGQRMLAEFETFDSCAEWLEQRPQFIDVLGPVDEHLDPEGEAQLKKALRPYDTEETALLEAAKKKREFELQQVMAADGETLEQRRAELEASVANRGPNDAMQVLWLRGGTLTNTEPLDKRSIPEDVKHAVEDWVKERDSWIHRRGQRVSEAVLTVWPGDVPNGESRVHSGGQFEVEELEGA
jgi:hypothetical protein